MSHSVEIDSILRDLSKLGIKEAIALELMKMAGSYDNIDHTVNKYISVLSTIEKLNPLDAPEKK